MAIHVVAQANAKVMSKQSIITTDTHTALKTFNAENFERNQRPVRHSGMKSVTYMT